MEELWVEAVLFGQIRQKCVSAASTVAVRLILRSIGSSSSSRGRAGTCASKGWNLKKAKLDKSELVSFSKKESDDSKHNKFRI